MTTLANQRDPTMHRVIAERLQRDHDEKVQFRSFAADYGIKSILDAYAVQKEYVARRQARTNARPIGYKIGLTSPASQAMCGVANPMFGVMLSNGIFADQVEFVTSDFVRLGLEFEILFRLGKDLPRRDRPFTVDEVSESVDGTCLSIEVFDDRKCDYGKFDALSLIADNGWNVGVICGPFQKRPPDLAGIEGVVLTDGLEIARPIGRNCLGNPLNALAWLANHLAESGMMLKAGDLVSTGTLVTPCYPSEPTRIDYRMDGLGQISCSVAVHG